VRWSEVLKSSESTPIEEGTWW